MVTNMGQGAALEPMRMKNTRLLLVLVQLSDIKYLRSSCGSQKQREAPLRGYYGIPWTEMAGKPSFGIPRSQVLYQRPNW